MKSLFLFSISLLLFISCKKDQPTNDCPMYKLQPSAYLFGNQQQACSLLASLQLYASLTPPVEIADIRAQLETGQTQPFDTVAFNNHLAELYALPLDTTALTNAERAILNTIFLYLNPSPIGLCCGGSDYPSTAPIQNPPATVNPDVEIRVYPRVGSSTFEHVMEMAFTSTISCDVHDIELTGIMGTVNPSPMSLVMQNLGCINGKRTFAYYYIDFGVDPYTPSGQSFSGFVNFRDASGATLSSSTFEWSF